MTTALVTGATAGLGAAFARRFASERRDVILVARDAERLDSVAASLRTTYRIDTEVIQADLATEDGCGVVEQRLADRDRPVEVLVNNAGVGLRSSFVDNDIEVEDQMLMLHIRAVMRLTHAALPGMLARGHGDIVNVASVAGFGPTNPGASYPASKSWVINFSESIYLDVRARGVRVSALCPGFVRTEFHERANIPTERIDDRLWLDADDVVRVGLLDLRRGRALSVPSVRYKLLSGVVRHVPRPLFHRIIGRASKTIGRTTFAPDPVSPAPQETTEGQA